jgi:hypothetical protein
MIYVDGKDNQKAKKRQATELSILKKSSIIQYSDKLIHKLCWHAGGGTIMKYSR